MSKFRQMGPTETWLWAVAEARQDNPDMAQARIIASEAISVWQGFLKQRTREAS